MHMICKFMWLLDQAVYNEAEEQLYNEADEGMKVSGKFYGTSLHGYT